MLISAVHSLAGDRATFPRVCLLEKNNFAFWGGCERKNRGEEVEFFFLAHIMCGICCIFAAHFYLFPFWRK